MNRKTKASLSADRKTASSGVCVCGKEDDIYDSDNPSSLVVGE